MRLFKKKEGKKSVASNKQPEHKKKPDAYKDKVIGQVIFFSFASLLNQRHPFLLFSLSLALLMTLMPVTLTH